MYFEITDPTQISTLCDQLLAVINAQSRVATSRTDGYPAGNFPAQVRFFADQPRSLWWCPGLSSTPGDVYNLFGHGNGDPASAEVLSIDLQFNFSRTRF